MEGVSHAHTHAHTAELDCRIPAVQRGQVSRRLCSCTRASVDRKSCTLSPRPLSATHNDTTKHSKWYMNMYINVCITYMHVLHM